MRNGARCVFSWRGVGISQACPYPCLDGRGGGHGGGSRPLPQEAVGAPAGAQVGTPQRLPATGNTEEGPVTPPHVVVPGPEVAPTIVSPQAPATGPIEERAITPSPTYVVGGRDRGARGRGLPPCPFMVSS
jgi:hypothetical protein